MENKDFENKGNAPEKGFNEHGEYIPAQLIGRYHGMYHLPWFSIFAPVVPYVYDGSLSILEMVQKLLMYINKVNKAVNDNHTDILSLAAEVDELAGQVAELPELIARIEALIEILPPLYVVRITTNGDEATANMTIDEIRAIVADGKIPMAIVDDNIIAIYNAEGETFQFANGNKSTIIGDFTDNIGSVETTTFITENGGIINGVLSIINAPVNATDAVNKGYVDEAINTSTKIIPFTVPNLPTTFANPVEVTFDEDEYNSVSNKYNILMRYRGNYWRCTYISNEMAHFMRTAGLNNSNVAVYKIALNFSTHTHLMYVHTLLDNATIENYINNLQTEIEDTEPFTVTVTPTTEGYNSDHYAGEIYENWNSGKIIKCKLGNAEYQLFSCSQNQSVFSCFGRSYISIISINTENVTEEGHYIVSTNGTTINNTIVSTLLLDYEINEPLEAVNKAYVDRAIAEGQTIRIVEYDVDNGTCELTCAEILDLISDGITPIAHAIIRGNESWGLLATISGNNLRYLFKFDVCKHTVALKHDYNETISLVEYKYITEKGGEILAGNRLTINGTLSIAGRGTIAAVDENNSLSLINKAYLDNALGESVPIVLNVEQSGSGYTLPYTYATLGTMLIRNPYIAIRWTESASHVEIMYLNGVENAQIIFGNSRYKGFYDTNSVLTFTAI